jgi:hypothetical protein
LRREIALVEAIPMLTTGVQVIRSDAASDLLELDGQQ